MQRPFALAGFSYFISLLFLIFIPNHLIFYVVITFGALFLISIAFPKIRKFKTLPILFITCFAAGLVYFFNLNNNASQIEKFDCNEFTIEGTICEPPYKKRSKYYFPFSKVSDIILLGDLDE